MPTGFEIVNSLNPLKQNLQGLISNRKFILLITSYKQVIAKSYIPTILVILKDMPQNILEMTQNSDEDAERLALFPTMDYKGLFDTLVLLIDDANLIHIGLQGTRNPTLILKFFQKLTSNRFSYFFHSFRIWSFDF